jgi:hypothetical protein
VADVRSARTAALVVALAAIIYGAVPSITSLLVLDGSTPSTSSTKTDAERDAPDHGSCSTRATTSTGPTDAN